MTADDPCDAAESARGEAVGAIDVERSDRARAIGAGLAMLVVVLAYGASSLGDPERWWASVVALVVGVLLADGLAALRAMLPVPGMAPLTLVATTFVVTLCVPETDQLPLVVMLPGALVFLEVLARRQFSIEWYVVSSAAIAWGAMFGATGRQSALAGALFAWWVVLLPAIAHLVRPVAELWRALTITGLAFVAASVFARTGGISDRNAELVISLVACSVVSVVATMWLVRQVSPTGDPTRNEPPRRDGSSQ